MIAKKFAQKSKINVERSSAEEIKRWIFNVKEIEKRLKSWLKMAYESVLN